MFGFLKKKLKESVDKISNIVKTKEDEPQIEDISEKIDDVIKDDIKEEREKKLAELDAEIAELQKKLEEPIVEKVEIEEVEETPIITVSKQVEEFVDEDIKVEEQITLEPEMKQESKSVKMEPSIEKKQEEIKKIQTKKKEGFLIKIKKAITEKELKEEDIRDILWDLQISLVQSDVAVEVAEKIINDLRSSLIGQSIDRKKIDDIVKESLKKSVKDILNVENIDLMEIVKKKKPYVIIFLGFNGSGKTTTIARVGHLFKEKGFSVVMAAADTWRAASIEQLEEHGKKLGINVIKQKYGSDPAAVIFDAVKHAKANDIDVVLADTAGRSHANLNLIEELKKICRVNMPDMKILVIDALTGNDVVEQTSTFNDTVGVDALILTKTDVYEKGGAILSSVHNIKKSILYLGVGQDYKDLKKFDPEEIIKNLIE
ncbi:MAG: signal recognition particle-docking protein FtsY [Nanoarchaeota archaeon]|nr:signal recognition particle-docking protein FtsY [Nanoarchaeota archaeon]MBU4123985.1 signal recognition particle-docking protein FtsY [Nanoarchaeota archaeon]